ncbi:MAG: cupin domain-containing protein [Candidatus Dormibacteraceae bacterium]
MREQAIVRSPGEGRAMLVGGADHVTFKATSAETGDAFFCFETSTKPGFGPPLHAHDYWELWYVLEGTYELTVQREDRIETIAGTTGTSVAVPPNVTHTFRNATDKPARMLFVHQPAALEAFFEEFGVPAPATGDTHDLEPPDFAAMAAALQRNGVRIVAEAKATH